MFAMQVGNLFGDIKKTHTQKNNLKSLFTSCKKKEKVCKMRTLAIQKADFVNSPSFLCVCVEVNNGEKKRKTRNYI